MTLAFMRLGLLPEPVTLVFPHWLGGLLQQSHGI